jgi:Lhr-like helicase
VAEYSSTLPQQRRTAILDQFRAGAIRVYAHPTPSSSSPFTITLIYACICPASQQTIVFVSFGFTISVSILSFHSIICSDAMARGMDVSGVQMVINYDAPLFIRTYIHRCGRTARGGKEGLAFTLCRKEEVRRLPAWPLMIDDDDR